MPNRYIHLVPVLWLAGVAPALADDASGPADGDVPCSALCRAWMGLGGAEARAPVASVPPVASAPLAAPPVLRPAVVAPGAAARMKPVARGADRPQAVAGRLVPLPPRRPAMQVLMPPAAVPPVSMLPVTSLRELPVAVLQGSPPVVPSPPPVADMPARAAAERPGPDPAVTPPRAAVEGAPSLSVAPAPAAVPPLAAPSLATADVPARDAASPPRHGTPWSVILGLYAALAALVGWGFRPRGRTAAASEAVPDRPARRRAPAWCRAERPARVAFASPRA